MNNERKMAQKSLKFSINQLNPEQRLHYRFLCIYSFFWWGFFSMYLIFQPLYLVHALNMPLWAVFINGALESVFIMIVSSKWSDMADKSGNLRSYMNVGNFFMALVCFFILAVENLPMLFLLSFFYRASPNSDVFATIYVYQIADNSRDQKLTPVQKKLLQINTFSSYRRFGSIGWALFAPIGGFLCNIYGFGINFILSGVGFIVLSLITFFFLEKGPNFVKNNLSPEISPIELKDNGNFITEEKLKNSSLDDRETILDLSLETPDKLSTVSLETPDKSSMMFNIRTLLKNPIFFVIIISGFLFSIAESITYSTQGIFYGLITNNNYLLIALAFSIAAIIEWPVMTWIARSLQDHSWSKVVASTYIMTSLRQVFVAMIAYYSGGILWVYLVQVLRGVIFGSYLPTITFGIYSSIEKSPNLALSLHRSTNVLAGFIGNLFGALISWIIFDEINMFIVLFILAFILSLIAGLVLIKRNKS